MNGLYKMPPVVGGRGAQRDEVFSAIHLPLHCFVLRSGKTALTTASFDASKISCTSSHPSTLCDELAETGASLTGLKNSSKYPSFSGAWRALGETGEHAAFGEAVEWW